MALEEIFAPLPFVLLRVPFSTSLEAATEGMPGSEVLGQITGLSLLLL